MIHVSFKKVKKFKMIKHDVIFDSVLYVNAMHMSLNKPNTVVL